MPRNTEEANDVGDAVCLKCVEVLLYNAGEQAEHDSWMLAFKMERLYSNSRQGTDRISDRRSKRVNRRDRAEEANDR